MTTSELKDAVERESRAAIRSLHALRIFDALKHLRAAVAAMESLQRRDAGVPAPKLGE